MNYLKAGLAGFGMSFIGTALCGAKTGFNKSHYDHNKEENKVFIDLLNKSFFYKDDALHVNNEFLQKIAEHIYIHKDKVDWKYFRFTSYGNKFLRNESDETNKTNYWYSKDGNWTVAKAFLINNVWSIPTSLLGALFHDKVGRDLTPKINDYFDSEISSYLITGGLFGAISTLGSGICFQHLMRFNLTQPWIYSESIIQGFLIGATAMAGAYFGDEKIEETVSQELIEQDNNISISEIYQSIT